MKRCTPFDKTEYFDRKPDIYSCAYSTNRKTWFTKDFSTYQDAMKYLEGVPHEYRYQKIYIRKQYSAIVSDKLYERVIPLQHDGNEVS